MIIGCPLITSVFFKTRPIGSSISASLRTEAARLMIYQLQDKEASENTPIGRKREVKTLLP